MSLKERIQEDMKGAMRSGDKDRLGTIRLIMAAVKQREVDERITLDDTQLLAVLEKMGKQRRESIAPIWWRRRMPSSRSSTPTCPRGWPTTSSTR